MDIRSFSQLPVEDLPILEVLDEILGVLRKERRLVLQAPPGAGKSTFLPLVLMREPWLEGRKIILLEPRRLAAKAVARRLAAQLGQPVGEEVGYRVRFETKVSARTRLEVVTEGILTRMVQSDNALEDVGLVIFDEFHERSIQADLGLVLCREVQEVLREDLRLLLMSATMNLDDLQASLPGVATIFSAGRQFPVETFYLPPPPGMRLSEQVARAVRLALREREGDLLVFLPGAADIRRTADNLADVEALVLPLFGDLPPAEQDRALLPLPDGGRKVVLATSIAETSLTIRGITTVVDSGFARVPRFDPRSGLTRLETVEVTADAAEQRAGRAGRLGPGFCYRLWEQARHQYLLPARQPEIVAADLAPLVLELAAWGAAEIEAFPWPTPPPGAALRQARDLLGQLGALEEGRVTERGKRLLALPTHPRLAQVLLVGAEIGRGGLAADVAAVLEERDPMSRGSGADLVLRLDALRQFREGHRHAGDRRVLQRIERLSRLWRQSLRCGPEREAADVYEVGRLLAAAYPERISKRAGSGPRYRLANGRQASLAAEDPLGEAEWLAVAQLDAGLQEGRIYLAAPFFPDGDGAEVEESDRVFWDAEAGRLAAQRERRIHGHLLDAKPLAKIEEADRVAALCAAIREDPSLLPWDAALGQWQARVLSLRSWRPEEAWPDVSQEALLGRVEEWLGPFLGAARKREDLQRLDLKGLLAGLLPWPLPQQLGQWAPESLEAPSGSQIRLEYFEDGRPPVMAVRLQEMFGCHDTPRVNGGRTPVMVHLLSPARRPVQVTQDLRNFWEQTYAEVRKELRGRYSKHYWPEDPFSAEAIRGVRPRRK